MAADGNGRETEPGSKGMNGQVAAPRSKSMAAKAKKKGFSLLSVVFR
jgi:hypothetical protein